MNHTLFSVLALALAALLAFSVMRSRVSTSQNAQRAEVLAGATDAGLELLDHIRTRPFDAATAGAAAPLTDPSLLTPAPFAAGAAFATATDVDDFHGMPPHTMDIGGLQFQATAAVQYVDETTLIDPSPTQSFAKEVTVFVWGEALPDTLELAQVVSY